MRRVLISALVVGVGVALLTAPAQARIRHCGNAFGSADSPGFAVRADHVTCVDARRAVRTIVRRGDLGPSKCTVEDPCRYHHFRCVARSSGDQLYRERCRNGTRVFSFGGGS
jgi:hypothetical protein